MVIKVSAPMKKREEEERTDEDVIMGKADTLREMTETRTQANELSVQKKSWWIR